MPDSRRARATISGCTEQDRTSCATKPARSKVSPPELARRYGVSPDKVLAWIRSGELRAIDASTKRGGRPRYLIDEEDVKAFEEWRAVVPERTTTGRRRRDNNPNVIEFF